MSSPSIKRNIFPKEAKLHKILRIVLYLQLGKIFLHHWQTDFCFVCLNLDDLDVTRRQIYLKNNNKNAAMR